MGKENKYLLRGELMMELLKAFHHGKINSKEQDNGVELIKREYHPYQSANDFIKDVKATTGMKHGEIREYIRSEYEGARAGEKIDGHIVKKYPRNFKSVGNKYPNAYKISHDITNGKGSDHLMYAPLNEEWFNINKSDGFPIETEDDIFSDKEYAKTFISDMEKLLGKNVLYTEELVEIRKNLEGFGRGGIVEFLTKKVSPKDFFN